MKSRYCLGRKLETLGRTFEILAGHSTGHWESRPNLRNLGWAFEILPGRSKSRLDLGNLGWTFKRLAQRSKSWPDLRKNENEKLDFEARKRASRFFRWSKIHVLNMNIKIPGSKIPSIIEKRRKMMKNILQSLVKIIKSLEIDVQKPLFFIWFFISDVQKCLLLIRFFAWF